MYTTWFAGLRVFPGLFLMLLLSFVFFDIPLQLLFMVKSNRDINSENNNKLDLEKFYSDQDRINQAEIEIHFHKA